MLDDQTRRAAVAMVGQVTAAIAHQRYTQETEPIRQMMTKHLMSHPAFLNPVILIGADGEFVNPERAAARDEVLRLYQPMLDAAAAKYGLTASSPGASPQTDPPAD